MSSKAGYLKQSKNIGHMLQQYGQQGSDFFANPMVQRGFGWVGQAVGSAIPIPIVGGQIGKAMGKTLAHTLSYGNGLMAEVGGAMNGTKSMTDVMTYVPRRAWEDIKNETVNSDLAKVIRGEKNWRDAVVDSLEENAMIQFLAPGKTHAWKDQQGNYHKEYVDGSKMVVGTWETRPNTQQRPDPSSNNIRIGPNGEVIRNGF